jgi:hypothetical protein
MMIPMFLGSSVVEQLAVNQLVAGSNPARGAIVSFFIWPLSRTMQMVPCKN